MSSDTVTAPVSAHVFLLGDNTDTVEALTHSFQEQGVAQSALRGACHLTGAALDALNHEIATITEGLLKLDLGDMLISGWRKYTELSKAAQRTLASPGSEELVVLATHRVVSTHYPSVEVLIDGVKVHTFVFELKVIFDLNGVIAVIRQGNLVALRTGECVVTATLTLQGTRLELSRKGHLNLPLAIRLHQPLPLTRKNRYPATPTLVSQAS
jgi:hypothetical protein